MKSIINIIILPGFGSLLPTIVTAFLFLSKGVLPSKPFVTELSIYYLFGLPVIAWVISLLQHAKSGRDNKFKSINPLALSIKSGPASANLVIIMGLVSVFIQFIDFYLKGFLNNITDFAANRDLVFAEGQVTAFSYLSYILAPISLYALVLAVYCFEELSRISIILLYKIAILHTALSVVFQSGRLYLISILLAWFWLSVQRPRFGKNILPKSPGFKSVLVAILFLSFLIIPLISIARSTKHDSALFAVEAVSPMVSLSPELIQVIESDDVAVAQIVAEICTYWTSAVQCFDKLYVFYDLPLDYSSCFSPFISRRLSELNLVPDNRTKNEAWGRIATEFRYFTNNLVTTAFSLMKSFGLTGGAVVFIAIVYLFNNVYISSDNNFSIVKEMMTFCIWNFNFGWFQRTAFEDPLFEYTLYWFAFSCLRQYFSLESKFSIKRNAVVRGNLQCN